MWCSICIRVTLDSDLRWKQGPAEEISGFHELKRSVWTILVLLFKIFESENRIDYNSLSSKTLLQFKPFVITNKYGIRGGSATFIFTCICICFFLWPFTFSFEFFVLIFIFICILIFHSVLLAFSFVFAFLFLHAFDST